LVGSEGTDRGMFPLEAIVPHVMDKPQLSKELLVAYVQRIGHFFVPILCEPKSES
jgi:hypothetical protein